MKTRTLENVYIERLWFGWIWIAQAKDGKKILVTGGALPGCTVDIKILKSKKDYVQGQLLAIKSFPKDMNLLNARCPHFYLTVDPDGQVDSSRSSKKGCGWCKWQILPYEDQLQVKLDTIYDSFRSTDLAGMWFNKIDIHPSPEVFGYRNKIEFTFGKYYIKDRQQATDGRQQLTEDNEQAKSSRENDFDGKDWLHQSKADDRDVKFLIQEDFQLWFNLQWDFSKVVDVDVCYLIDEKLQVLYSYLKKLFLDSWLPFFDKKTHEWVMRHLLIRQGKHTDQVLVNLVIHDKNMQKYVAQFENLKNQLLNDEYIKSVCTTFVITYNSDLADVAKGRDSQIHVLYGEWYIFENLIFSDQNVKLTMRVSPFSFFQTNTLGAQVLFQRALAMVKPSDTAILDLYCGTGTIWMSALSLWLWSKLYGVEIVESAIQDAYLNARINGLEDKSYFVAGKAEELIYKDPVISQAIQDIKLVIVDPPRDWLHKDVIEFLLNLKKKTDFQLLYISCNPVTLARDIALLHEGGMKLQKIEAVDMFPHTHHVELLTLIY